MKTLLLVISLFVAAIATAQPGIINQLDSNGKKDGKWTVYYNGHGKEVGDSVQAVYCRYTWYEHRKDLYPFDWCSKHDQVIAPSDSPQGAGLKILDGEYRIQSKKGMLKSIHVFNKGEYVSYRSFYPSGRLHVYCNFTNRHFDEPHSYCKRMYSKTGTVRYYYMHDQPNDEDLSDLNPAEFERRQYDSTSVTHKKVVGDSIFATATVYIDSRPLQQVDQIFMKEGDRPVTHGKHLTFYSNGQIKEERQYDHNKRIGETKYWNEDGTEIKSEIDFTKLNSTDTSGAKTGWWIQYLDYHLKPLNDSVGATHVIYNYYTDKFFHYRYGNRLGSKKFPVHFPESDTLKRGNFNLLNGDYITRYENGNIRSVLSASNGILTECKEYYPNGQLHVHCIYSADCGAPIRMCLMEYNKKGNPEYDGANWVPRKYNVNNYFAFRLY
jgi:antitoxin component YwqK of YwqJK toxin-antitoxin module